MIQIVWEYVVEPGAEERFEEAYGAEGAWAVLFRRHDGYLGTALYRDVADARRFLTIDRWESAAHFEAMRRGSDREYRELDGRCERLTAAERQLGALELRV